MPSKGQVQTRRALVGQPLLYTISCFASIGVFLASRISLAGSSL
jgi:hypothetical protein